MPPALAGAYAHCQAMLREAAHDRWLASLFAPAERRPFLHALEAFFLEIGQVRDRVRQPLAGEPGLQWWVDAIESAAPGDAAANPVAAAFLDALARHDLSRGMVLDAIEVFRLDLYREAWADTGELEGFLDATRGAALRLAAGVLAAGVLVAANDPHPIALDQAARHAAVAEGIVGVLERLPRAVAAGGRVDVPHDVLARHGVTPGTLQAGNDTSSTRAVLADLRALARNHLAALRAAKRGIPAVAEPAFLLSSLVEPVLRASERAENPFLEPPDLVPLRRHWILWRAARTRLV